MEDVAVIWKSAHLRTGRRHLWRHEDVFPTVELEFLDPIWNWFVGKAFLDSWERQGRLRGVFSWRREFLNFFLGTFNPVTNDCWLPVCASRLHLAQAGQRLAVEEPGVCVFVSFCALLSRLHEKICPDKHIADVIREILETIDGLAKLSQGMRHVSRWEGFGDFGNAARYDHQTSHAKQREDYGSHVKQAMSNDRKRSGGGGLAQRKVRSKGLWQAGWRGPRA